MKKIFCCTVAISIVTGTANAYLNVNTDSDLGRNCYSDADSGWYLIECGPASMSDVVPSVTACPKSYSDIHDIAENGISVCSIGSVGDKLRICAFSSTNMAEIEILCEELFNGWFDWTYIGNYRVSHSYGSSSAVRSGEWSATVSIEKETEYGCADGYYQSAGSGATMTCSPCPASGDVTGKSEVGNTSITGCYIPSGNKFDDNTGSGVYTDSCYYTNK